MATIPDRAEHQRRFAALDTADRREIIRSVNRGREVEKRKLAPLAVGVARRQKRFWKYAWLVAPAMALVQLLFVPPDLVIMSGVVSTLTLGAMAFFFWRRAARAEHLNLGLAAGPSAAGRRHPGQATAFGRHLPGRAGADGTPAGDEHGVDDERDAAPRPATDRKPYKPRGRKRR